MPTHKTTRDSAWNGYSVQASNDDPLRTDILTSIEERLDWVLRCCGSAMIQRFDLHFPQDGLYPHGNEIIQACMLDLARHTRHRGVACHFVWVREHEKGTPHHHYHCVFMLDGRAAMNTDEFMADVRHYWSHALRRPDIEGVHLVHECLERYRSGFMCNGDVVVHGDMASRQQCLFWLSYLAKCRTKGNRPEHVRVFSCSQLGD